MKLKSSSIKFKLKVDDNYVYINRVSVLVGAGNPILKILSSLLIIYGLIVHEIKNCFIII